MVTPIPVPPPRERGQDAAGRKLSHSRSAPHPKPSVARAPPADAKPSRRIDPAPDELSPERNLHFNDTAQFGFDKAERVSAYLTADMEQAGVEPEKAELWTRCLMFTAKTFDLNPLFVYAVTRHESGGFSRRLDAESAGNDFYPVRRDKQGRVVDAGVFGVAQVRYGAHRKLVPWAEKSLERIARERVNLLDAATAGDDRIVSAISLLMSGYVLRMAIIQAPGEMKQHNVRGVSRVAGALQIYNRGNLRNHDARLKYTRSVLHHWAHVIRGAAVHSAMAQPASSQVLSMRISTGDSRR